MGSNDFDGGVARLTGDDCTDRRGAGEAVRDAACVGGVDGDDEAKAHVEDAEHSSLPISPSARMRAKICGSGPEPRRRLAAELPSAFEANPELSIGNFRRRNNATNAPSTINRTQDAVCVIRRDNQDHSQPHVEDPVHLIGPHATPLDHLKNRGGLPGGAVNYCPTAFRQNTLDVLS